MKDRRPDGVERAPLRGPAALLLRLLPAEFRDRFGDDMEEALREEYEEAARSGLRGRFGFWRRGLGDVLRTVPREHLTGLGLDLRTTWRALVSRPLFLVVTVLSLAIGIGATTSVLAIVEATFGRGIPGASHDDRLVNVKLQADVDETFSLTSYPTWTDLRRSGVLEDLAGFSGNRMSFAQSGDAVPGLLGVQAVTSNYFSVLGVEPALGRLLDEDDESGRQPVAVLSHWLWTDRYGADLDVLGETVRINGEILTIVGVAAPGFRGHFIGFHFDAFVPVSLGEAVDLPSLQDREASWIEMVGLQARDTSLEEAAAGFAIEAERLEGARPDLHRGLEITVERCDGHDADLRGGLQAFLGILAAVSGLVLLIGCVNVANLMLGRLVQRRHELELRTALGAPRSRLARQQLVESLLLALLAGALGTALAWVVTRVASRSIPGLGGIQVDVRLDPRVLVGALAISLVAALVFGLLPALRASRGGLASSTRGTGGSGGRPLRSLLVVAQVALSVVVLVAAGLFLRALQRASALDPGFEPEHVLQVRLDPSLAGIEPVAGRALFEDALASARALPGVEQASLASGVPLSLGARFFPNTALVEIPGVEPPAEQDGFQIEHAAVSPGYLETLRIPLVAGRDFEMADIASERTGEAMRGVTARTARPGRGVVLVNQTFATRFLDAGGRESLALGSTLRVDGRDVEVVGVVRDSRYRTLDEEPIPFVYENFGRGGERRATLLVRTEPDLAGLDLRLRDELHALAPELPLPDLGALEDQLAVSLLPQRIGGAVAGVLGLVGLFLTAVGLYGVLAHLVEARIGEIGVRMSLGASPRDVLGLVLRSGAALAALGLVAGLLAALLVSRGLRSFLYGLGAFDTWTYLGITALLLFVALIAAWLPARRAARVDVVTVLRAE